MVILMVTITRYINTTITGWYIKHIFYVIYKYITQWV